MGKRQGQIGASSTFLVVMTDCYIHCKVVSVGLAMTFKKAGFMVALLSRNRWWYADRLDSDCCAPVLRLSDYSANLGLCAFSGPPSYVKIYVWQCYCGSENDRRETHCFSCGLWRDGNCRVIAVMACAVGVAVGEGGAMIYAYKNIVAP